jgi:hypothetical protein
MSTIRNLGHEFPKLVHRRSVMHRRRSLRIEVLEDRRFLAPDFQRVKDINTNLTLNDALSPRSIRTVGSIVYFQATLQELEQSWGKATGRQQGQS